jgi:hypothetical protein
VGEPLKYSVGSLDIMNDDRFAGESRLVRWIPIQLSLGLLVSAVLLIKAPMSLLHLATIVLGALIISAVAWRHGRSMMPLMLPIFISSILVIEEFIIRNNLQLEGANWIRPIQFMTMNFTIVLAFMGALRLLKIDFR